MTWHYTVHFKCPLLPFWVESSLNMLNLYVLPTTREATLGQEILHCGSGICLCNCISSSSTDKIFSLPNQHNQSPTNTSLGVARSHPIFILCPNHISMDCNVLHNFLMPSLFVKTNKVFFSSHFCVTTSFMVEFS